MKPAAPNSAQRLNPIIDDLRSWALDTRESLLRAFYASGYPPGAEKVSPDREYQNLVNLRGAGDPRFWKSQEAQHRLEQLSKRFGPPPMLPVPQHIAQAPLVAPPFAPPSLGPQIVPGGPPAQVPGLLQSLVGTQALRSVVRERKPQEA